MEEIARFLHEHPPFSLLTFEQVQSIAAHVQIEYFLAETDILTYNAKPSAFLYIIRRGSVDTLRETEDGIQHIDTYGEGEIFGHLSILRRKPPLVTVRTREEVLAYLLPARIFERLCAEQPALKQFFSSSVTERLNWALQAHGTTPGDSELFRLRMRNLASPALMVPPYTSIRHAAQMMRDADTSCVVVNTEPLGIVSDRDLRNRVLAVGLSDSAHVVRVMSSPVLTLPADSLAFEGLMLMVEHNIHHIPITEDGHITSVVTHTELLRQQSRSPLLLPRMLEQANTAEDLRHYTAQVQATGSSLLQEGARVSDIGRMVAIANDALLVHLLREAEAELGKPPCPYAWLVLGSGGRYEQTVRTDQDNALVYADDAPQWAEVYFADLAERIVAKLEWCGFPRCPGDIMATNPQWRKPLHVWKSYFEDWIRRPEEQSLINVTVFFDFRRAYGELEIEKTLHPVIESARQQKIFLGRLVRVALRRSPPLGFFRNFVLEHNGDERDLLDLKHRGVGLIVDLARIRALEVGSPETNTLARMRSAVEHNGLDKESADELAAAYELISLLRLRHQYRQIERGEEPSNMVPVSELSKLEQRDLKEAFRSIATNQRVLESTYQVGMLG
jgi:CBS domain-containing protein